MSAEDETWTTGDVAKRLGVTSERARQLTHREGFPKPVAQVRHIRVWRAVDVEKWISENRPGA